MRTPKTDPNVLVNKMNPAPASLLFEDWRNNAISIGLIDERRIRGNANKIALPRKLPVIRPTPESFGKAKGYRRQESPINRALNTGKNSRSDSWYFSSNLFVNHPPN